MMSGKDAVDTAGTSPLFFFVILTYFYILVFLRRSFKQFPWEKLLQF